MKFLDLLKEQEGEVSKFHRKVLNRISSRFDLSQIIPGRTYPWNELVAGIRKYLKEDLSLEDKECDIILMLLLLNRGTEDFMIDTLSTGEGYYLYEIFYYGDELEELEKEVEEECEECGGSGWEEETCNVCDGEGDIDVGEDEMMSCDECDGAGHIDVDCHWCGGNINIVHKVKMFGVDRFHAFYMSPIKLMKAGYNSPVNEIIDKLDDPIMLTSTYEGMEEEEKKSNIEGKLGKIDYMSVTEINNERLHGYIQ